jgi:hypothetical protein
MIANCIYAVQPKEQLSVYKNMMSHWSGFTPHEKAFKSKPGC